MNINTHKHTHAYERVWHTAIFLFLSNVLHMHNAPKKDATRTYYVWRLFALIVNNNNVEQKSFAFICCVVTYMLACVPLNNETLAYPQFHICRSHQNMWRIVLNGEYGIYGTKQRIIVQLVFICLLSFWYGVGGFFLFFFFCLALHKS